VSFRRTQRSRPPVILGITLFDLLRVLSNKRLLFLAKFQVQQFLHTGVRLFQLAIAQRLLDSLQ
jgi:hypothetical protein